MNGALPRQRWLDPIDAFVQEHGRGVPRWAAICTYECDLVRLEREVIPALSRRGRGFRTLVLADAGALQKQLSQDAPLRARFNVHPVRLAHGGRGIFHPKLVFLRAGSAARVCFGSANVSTGGFGGNLELWTHTDDFEIVGAVARFLDQLATNTGVWVDPACARGIARAVAGIEMRASGRVWTSIDESFAERVARSPKIENTTLNVVSPAYATPKGLVEVRKAFPCTSLTLHTDDNVVVPATKTLVYDPAIPGDVDEAGADQADPPRLHAKLFVFRDSQSTRAWIGSANFTAQALTRTPSNGGNVELLIETALPKGQAACLAEDLSRLFQPSNEPPTQRVEDDAEGPGILGAVISCELVQARSGPSLVVHTTPGASSVRLESGKVVINVAIQNARGVVRGADVPRMLPGCDDSGAGIWVISERVGAARYPVVVNSPHVPDYDTSLPTQAPLDALLDELRGVLPPPRTVSDDVEDVVPDMNDANDWEDYADDDGKCLAEVNHQGALDQVAVKAAVATKLVKRLTSGGTQKVFLQRLETDCKAGCAPHLHSVIARWFSR